MLGWTKADIYWLFMGFPGSSVGKESACNAGDPGLYFWFRKIPWRRYGPPTAVFLGFPGCSAGKESACNAGDLGLIPVSGRSPGGGNGHPFWRRKWQPTPVFLPRKSHGQRSLVQATVHGVAKSQA